MLRYIIGITLITIGIIIVRALANGRVLKKHQYAFWLVVPVCMVLLPFIKIDLPIVEDLNSVFAKTDETLTYDAVKYDVIGNITDDEVVEAESAGQISSADQSINEEPDNLPVIDSEDELITNHYIEPSDNKTKEHLRTDVLLGYISLSISSVLIIALLVYNAGFISYCRRKREYVGRDPESGLKIFSVKHKGTPFLLFNKIYVDKDSGPASEYIIRHEACHYKHCDHIWVLVRYLVLFLNWYNPVMWIAFFLSGRDCELACDEEVLRICGTDSSAGYVETLLDLLKQHSRKAFSLSVSTGMRGGYKMMKKRILSIKKPANNSRKALALSLAAILLFTSCSFVNTSNDKKITANTPWYNVEILDFEPETDKNKTVSDMWQYLAGSDDKYIAVYSQGGYKIPDPSGPYDAIQLVTLIDRPTKQTVKTIDLFDVVGKHDYPENASYYNGQLFVYVDSWDPDTDIYSDVEYVIDADTEKIINTYNYGEGDHGFQAPEQYYIGDYRIEADRPDMSQNTSYYVLRVFSPDGSMKQVDVKDPVEGVYEIPFVFALDDNTALVSAAVSRSYKYFKLDLNTCELTEVNAEDYSWIDPDHISSVFNGSDGNVYFTTTQGISKIDLNNKSTEEYMNYSSSSINMNYTSRLQIADFSEDKILLGGRYSSSNMFESQYVSSFVIVELTKAAKNPHAGKMIMELYIPKGEMNGIISDAIIRFNETNKKYYIQVTDRYNTDNYIRSYGQFRSNDDRDNAYMNADAQMSYELAMDIMNGEGPDILMNTSRLGQLNNDNFLIDLSIYTQELDSSKYYTNIINGAKTNEKLYQIPISYTIEGIQTSPENAGKSKIGFTPEEYKGFISESLNGKDLIESGQALYFTKLFTGMSDEFIVGGRVNFSGPDFADIAEYVKENVPQNSVAWNTITDGVQEDPYETATKGTQTAIYCNCPGISGYLVKRYQIKDGTTILGLPSSDGRGPMFGTDISVAVSKNAVNIEACVEFVKMLLTDEVQEDLAMNDKFVLNRAAFRKSCSAAIEYYNSSEGKDNLFDYEIGTNVPRRSKFQDEEIDNMENIILSCSKMNSPDSAINLILAEEMPAYFLGQKDLDAVIKIAQDRVQKVLDERG